MLTAEIIISNGADPNTPDAQGRRPLHEAAFFGHADMVDCLLAHDAFIDAPAPPFGHTALYMAVERGHHDIARLLLKKGAWAGVTDALSGQGLLHMAAAKGDTQLAGLLVAAGVSVFHEDRKGCTARDYAVRYNHCDLDRVLLKLMEHHARYCPAG